MVLLYALTLFVSSGLLLFVQPMFARMVLPLLGGSPAVWNAAMVFYQATLLAGYAYAHFGPLWLGLRRHAWWHLLILILPLFFLSIAVPSGWVPPVGKNPTWWLFGLMAVAVGMPFFVVSTTSSIIQKWFAGTGHPLASDPYFLYAASNVGSLLALISYPLVVEPHFYLEQQSHFWTCGYLGLAILIVGCMAYVQKSTVGIKLAENPTGSLVKKVAPDRLRRLRWVFLSFVPSSLLLSVTTYLSSDVAVIPLMWILPLSLYLLTFSLAFMRRRIVSNAFLAKAWPIALVPLLLALNIEASLPIGILMVLHVGAFFIAALYCHTELAADRPHIDHLTEFYLWISVGGVLGGIFNVLLAPLIFQSVIEYPLMLVLVCLANWRGGAFLKGDLFWPLLLGGLMLGAIELVKTTSAVYENNAVGYLVFGLPALSCYFFSKRPLRFAFGIAVILLAGSFYHGDRNRVLAAERSFFGVHRVVVDQSERYHVLIHGVTTHGKQSLDPAHRHEPLAYYHWSGPIGQVFESYGQKPQAKIAIVGLGAGSLAGFAQPGQSWTFYEIDPVVVKLASDPHFFTFLSEAKSTPSIILGDARLSLALNHDKYDLLILDAYSSDSIPLHLVTREALALYLDRLAPKGILAFHISNVHLDLEPVFANLGLDAKLICLTRDDTHLNAQETALGKTPSTWLVMARQREDVIKLVEDARWNPSRSDEKAKVWTDHYSSLLNVFRWR